MKSEFKISVVSELESGKPLAQIASEHGIHPSLPCRWQDELAENPERAKSDNCNLKRNFCYLKIHQPSFDLISMITGYILRYIGGKLRFAYFLTGLKPHFK